ncbi:hypothetical protein [Sediminitomix flava]|uniref:Uncharacterized protein n=1 Tax=Sediminitomix flava TaxID=379075 RepID=A0A315Z2C7_SEDFL|nr:hypothetical protein [Sediminitomix flava]PWJ36150.1 hypothetical protein BC781_109169 [Sediminitomix flava]
MSNQNKTVGQAITEFQHAAQANLIKVQEAMDSSEEVTYLEVLSKAIIAQKSSEFIANNIFDLEDDFTTSGALLELEVYDLQLNVNFGARALAKARFVSQLNNILSPMGWEQYAWD